MPNSDFGPDGTQAPPPPRLFPDPLAGLVTADTWIAPQWTSGYSTSRVSVPTPPTPTEEMRQAIWTAMEQEHRRPRGRRQRAPQEQGVAVPQMPAQMPVVQQQQPAKQSGGVAAFIGCLIVIGFFVLVVVNILGAIFSG
ncbi:hypothetical protein [Lentzea flava]|uniref:DUF4190 domain-containing protein n=1 Tax=Lentzea flava TaxID=103732 RepID=A0ABQ2USK9_9PSEU|nr:hypothetical protein [Lentzea flava]MCP2201240.1 hypothetical protein [Lentzea flava]GGU49646.1 hypothetical protein GCM10010178_48050 [Lentzea flava]